LLSITEEFAKFRFSQPSKDTCGYASTKMAPSWTRTVQKGRKLAYNSSKSLKRKRDEEDLEALSKRVAELDPKPSTPPAVFVDLPLSKPTQSGLKESQFTKLTTIQASGIPPALKGADILGAAKTGSGKTLGFLVPTLENLYRKRWTEYDGLGALILSPTRELAIQIFEVLRKVGRYHTFSAGLVIGGKSLQEERDRLGRMNILVATPGRMLQHMDQTAEFEIGNLQMLVLDEADRIMDMGFKDTVDAIVEHLPKERQTLLFSATQTKRVSDLARLSLKEPEFVSAHEGADSATPATLQQNYVVTPLPEKLDTLWSFIRTNLKKKILVFLSSGKQVRFVYEAFRHLQPGLPLLHLHGRQKQTARLDITTRFSASKSACLFATDVAARGLDFPAVDWVVQVDCPEDADTYIHRVGRTARYERDGQAVMFVDPSEEEGMLAALERKKVVLEKISVRGGKMQGTIKNQLQNMCFKDPELKYLGQKAFVSYVRSVHIQKDKNVFKVQNLDLKQFAASMGLPGAPRVKFVKGEDAKRRKNAPRQLLAVSSDSEGGDAGKKEKPEVKTKYDRMFQRRNQDVLAEHYAKMIDTEDDEGANRGDAATADADEDNEFLAVKRWFDAGDAALGGCDASNSDEEADETDTPDQGSKNEIKPVNGGAHNGKAATSSNGTKKAIQLSNHSDEMLFIDSKRREKLLKSKKKLLKFKGHGAHLRFDDDNVAYEAEYYQREEEFAKSGRPDEQREAFVEAEKQKTEVADREDKETARRKRREKKEKRKAREREMEEDEDGGERVAMLVPYKGDGLEDEGDMDVVEKPKKRLKKWFEDASSGDEEGQARDKKRKKQNMRSEDAPEPQTLEDLEEMAQGLLGK
jgi:ATP-dependent RNA helicase DDX10/DBP4